MHFARVLVILHVLASLDMNYYELYVFLPVSILA